MLRTTLGKISERIPMWLLWTCTIITMCLAVFSLWMWRGQVFYPVMFYVTLVLLSMKLIIAKRHNKV